MIFRFKLTVRVWNEERNWRLTDATRQIEAEKDLSKKISFHVNTTCLSTSRREMSSPFCFTLHFLIDYWKWSFTNHYSTFIMVIFLHFQSSDYGHESTMRKVRSMYLLVCLERRRKSLCNVIHFSLERKEERSRRDFCQPKRKRDENKSMCVWVWERRWVRNWLNLSKKRDHHPLDTCSFFWTRSLLWDVWRRSKTRIIDSLKKVKKRESQLETKRENFRTQSNSQFHLLSCVVSIRFF